MKHLFTLKGQAGLLFKVAQYNNGLFGYQDQKGYGLTNESLPYILRYLEEVWNACQIVEIND